MAIASPGAVSQSTISAVGAGGTKTLSLTTTTENAMAIFVALDSGTTTNAVTITVDGTAATFIAGNGTTGGATTPAAKAFYFSNLKPGSHSIIATIPVATNVGLVAVGINDAYPGDVISSFGFPAGNSASSKSTFFTVLAQNSRDFTFAYIVANSVTGPNLLSTSGQPMAALSNGVYGSLGTNTNSVTFSTTVNYAIVFLIIPPNPGCELSLGAAF